MWDAGGVDDASWAALTLSLTVLGGVWTWLSFRRRGAASGVRAFGITLLPLAAYLTKTLRMFTEIVEAITSWATRLVFSPSVWLGVLVAGVAVLLLVVGGWLRGRELAAGRGGSAARVAGSRESKPVQPAARTGDPELDEIEALLRKRGIS